MNIDTTQEIVFEDLVGPLVAVPFSDLRVRYFDGRLEPLTQFSLRFEGPLTAETVKAALPAGATLIKIRQ